MATNMVTNTAIFIMLKTVLLVTSLIMVQFSIHLHCGNPLSLWNFAFLTLCSFAPAFVSFSQIAPALSPFAELNMVVDKVPN